MSVSSDRPPLQPIANFTGTRGISNDADQESSINKIRSQACKTLSGVVVQLPQTSNNRSLTPKQRYDFAVASGNAEEQARALTELSEESLGHRKYRLAVLQAVSKWLLAERKKLITHQLSAPRLLAAVQNAFLKWECGVTDHSVGGESVSLYRARLRERRQEVSNKLARNSVTNIEAAKLLTQHYRQLVADLIRDAETMLGPPPTEYVAIGCGSMARDEMCLYSDVEWAILVADDSSDNLPYFRNLASLVQLQIACLGETRHWDERFGRHHGFAEDTAGFTPCGASKGEELIGTPTSLAHIQDIRWDGLVGISRIALRSVTPIAASTNGKGLVAEYRAAVERILGSPNDAGSLRLRRATEMFRKPTEPGLLRPGLIEADGIVGVKTDCYRPLQLGVAALALQCGVTVSSTADRVNNLEKLGAISSKGAEHLRAALEKILRLRWEVQAHYGVGRDDLHIGPVANGLCAGPKHSQQLEAIYATLLPFLNAVDEFLSSGGALAKLSKNPFRYRSPLERGQALEKRGQLLMAREAYAEALASDPKQISVLESLAELEHATGDFENEVRHRRSVVLLEQENQQGPHLDISWAQLKLGKALHCVGSFRDATHVLLSAVADTATLSRRTRDEKELAELEQLCREAAYWLGENHCIQATPDYTRAVRHFESAAQTGSKEARLRLALCLQHGLGTSPNESKARQMYEEAGQPYGYEDNAGFLHLTILDKSDLTQLPRRPWHRLRIVSTAVLDLKLLRCIFNLLPQTIRVLDFSGSVINCTAMREIAHLLPKCLEELNLSNCRYMNREALSLVAETRLTNLKVLDVSGCPDLYLGLDPICPLSFPELQKLRVSTELPRNLPKSLLAVEVVNREVGEEALSRVLIQLPELQSLKILVGSTGTYSVLAAHMPGNLQELYVQPTGWGEEVASLACVIENLPKSLRSLSLVGVKDGAGCVFESLARNRPPMLESLMIRWSQTTHESLSAVLASLPKSLKVLDAHYAGVGDAELAAMKKNMPPQLEYLDISASSSPSAEAIHSFIAATPNSLANFKGPGGFDSGTLKALAVRCPSALRQLNLGSVVAWPQTYKKLAGSLPEEIEELRLSNSSIVGSGFCSSVANRSLQRVRRLELFPALASVQSLHELLLSLRHSLDYLDLCFMRRANPALLGVGMSRLRVLKIKGMSDQLFLPLVRELPQCLRKITLDRTHHFTDRSIHALAERKLPQLEVLTIWESPLLTGDQLSRALSRTQRKLVLSKCKGIKERQMISLIKDLPAGLQELRIWYCGDYSGAVHAALKTRCSNGVLTKCITPELEVPGGNDADIFKAASGAIETRTSEIVLADQSEASDSIFGRTLQAELEARLGLSGTASTEPTFDNIFEDSIFESPNSNETSLWKVDATIMTGLGPSKDPHLDSEPLDKTQAANLVEGNGRVSANPPDDDSWSNDADSGESSPLDVCELTEGQLRLRAILRRMMQPQGCVDLYDSHMGQDELVVTDPGDNVSLADTLIENSRKLKFSQDWLNSSDEFDLGPGGESEESWDP